MDGKTTIKYLQNYIKSKDYNPEIIDKYFFKLIEEVGELSEVMRQNILAKDTGQVKGTIDEELWDVIYYILAIANCYGIDMEETIKIKEDLNNIKWNNPTEFEENR